MKGLSIVRALLPLFLILTWPRVVGSTGLEKEKSKNYFVCKYDTRNNVINICHAREKSNSANTQLFSISTSNSDIEVAAGPDFFFGVSRKIDELPQKYDIMSKDIKQSDEVELCTALKEKCGKIFIEETLKDYEKKISSLEEDINNNNKRLEKAKSDKDDIPRIKKEIEEMEKEIEPLKKEIEVRKKEIEALTKEIEKMGKEIEAMKEEIKNKFWNGKKKKEKEEKEAEQKSKKGEEVMKKRELEEKKRKLEKKKKDRCEKEIKYINRNKIDQTIKMLNDSIKRITKNLENYKNQKAALEIIQNPII